jgi:hypothetical protein
VLVRDAGYCLEHIIREKGKTKELESPPDTASGQELLNLTKGTKFSDPEGSSTSTKVQDALTMGCRSKGCSPLVFLSPLIFKKTLSETLWAQNVT